jgi:hypothetical protein
LQWVAAVLVHPATVVLQWVAAVVAHPAMVALPAVASVAPRLHKRAKLSDQTLLLQQFLHRQNLSKLQSLPNNDGDGSLFP